jgi:type IV pilus assembly protein PilM
MLSFDITDRNIRIVMGSESSGKIRIKAAASLDLDPNIIMNGKVADANYLAMAINKVLKMNRMGEKDALVTISSNLIVFKEISVKKSDKKSEFTRNVYEEVRSSLGTEANYSVSYVIVGDDPADSESNLVLATACPYEIIEGYKKLFENLLQINLRGVIIGCNSISKVILADRKNEQRMPLLTVQVDPNFLSLNIYDNSRLVFSRFASIDRADYGDVDDYVFDATIENIGRLVQYYRTKNPKAIENVIVYGDTSGYDKLAEKMNENDIRTSIITAPAQVHGYENLEFAAYANAIGAIFSRDESREFVNLLKTDTINNAALKSDKFYGNILVMTLLGSMLICGGAWFFVLTDRNKAADAVQEVQAKINSPETIAAQEQYKKLTAQLDKVRIYYNSALNVVDAYKTQPLIETKYFDMIDIAVSRTVYAIPGSAIQRVGTNTPHIASMSVSQGTLTFDVKAYISSSVPASDFAAKLGENLESNTEFFSVEHTGYTLGEETINEVTYRTITVSLSVELSATDGSVSVGADGTLIADSSDTPKTDGGGN